MKFKYFILWLVRRLLLALRVGQYKHENTSHKHRFLERNFSPLTKEAQARNLKVEGSLPPLRGCYIRNGPNPYFREGPYDFPFDGDGMLHQVFFDEEGVHYQNKWVQTHGLKAEIKAGKRLYSSLLEPRRPGVRWLTPKWMGFVPIKNTASVNVVQFGSDIVALSEAQRAYHLNPNLATVGYWKPKRAFMPLKVNAHYRKFSGKYFMFAYDSLVPEIIFYELSSSGELKEQKRIYKDRVSMVHDFAVTKNYKVFFDCPALFNWRFKESFVSWKPEEGTYINLIRNNDNQQKISIPNCFVFHIVNAYEEIDQLIIDAITYPKFWSHNHKSSSLPGGTLTRYSIDLNSGSVSLKSLLYNIEFPVIEEKFCGVKHPRAFFLQKSKGLWFDRIISYDFKTNSLRKTSLCKHEFSEPFLVEVDNTLYLLSLSVSDKTQKSSLMVFSADNLGQGDIAKINLPCRIPHGLHGSWLSKV